MTGSPYPALLRGVEGTSSSTSSTSSTSTDADADTPRPLGHYLTGVTGRGEVSSAESVHGHPTGFLGSLRLLHADNPEASFSARAMGLLGGVREHRLPP